MTITNRVHYFITSILENSKLNREKFVKNKNKYNITLSKNKANHNRFIVRKMTTFVRPPLSFGNDGGNGNGPNNPFNGGGPYLLFMAAAGLSAYMSSGTYEKNEKFYNKK